MKTIVRRHIIVIFILIGGMGSEVAAQRLSFGANAVELLNLGTINGELSYGINRKWSLLLSATYNPFVYNSSHDSEQFQNKEASISMGTRFWPWHLFSGWFVGSRVQYRTYNFGGLLSETSEEGKAIGMGLNGGYSLMITKNFNIEFGAGLMVGGKDYTLFACPRCGRIVKSGRKVFLLPDNLLLQFVVLF